MYRFATLCFISITIRSLEKWNSNCTRRNISRNLRWIITWYKYCDLSSDIMMERWFFSNSYLRNPLRCHTWTIYPLYHLTVELSKHFGAHSPFIIMYRVIGKILWMPNPYFIPFGHVIWESHQLHNITIGPILLERVQPIVSSISSEWFGEDAFVIITCNNNPKWIV